MDRKHNYYDEVGEEYFNRAYNNQISSVFKELACILRNELSTEFVNWETVA